MSETPTPPPFPSLENPAPVRLWSPGALTLLGLFCLPIAAFLAIFNWRALRNRGQAGASIFYVALILLIIAGSFAVGDTKSSGSSGTGTSLAFPMFFVWYALTVRPMKKDIDVLPHGYVKRSVLLWWVPVVGLYALIIAALFIDTQAAPKPEGAPTPESAATTVKSSFEKSWKGSALEAAKIKSVSLHRDGSNEYKGRMIVEIAGVSKEVDLAAVFHPDTRMINSETVNSEPRWWSCKFFPPFFRLSGRGRDWNPARSARSHWSRRATATMPAPSSSPTARRKPAASWWRAGTRPAH
ncbi:MAG TPA: hypothetical protein VGO11_01965 [Chthoniobacteraceae bacterium]|jgi:hypothetical protein|nr:hypothetical protein [Chthoniobacteraceae bacterium]